MDPKHQRRELTDGRFIPVLGFGTFAPEELAKGEVEMAVKRAIDAGYRHIDSAYLYQNEEEIGRAIQEKMADGTVKRDDIFYTTKHPTFDYASRGSYTDHSSLPFPPEAMEKCKDAGLAKSIGVSNFNHEQLEKILNKPGSSTSLSATRVKKNHPALLQDPVLGAIAEKHGRTPAQVALRYQLQRGGGWGGVVALAKSFNEERMKENFQVFDFQLTPEDMERLDGLNRDMHYMDDEPVKATEGGAAGCRGHRLQRSPHPCLELTADSKPDDANGGHTFLDILKNPLSSVPAVAASLKREGTRPSENSHVASAGAALQVGGPFTSGRVQKRRCPLPSTRHLSFQVPRPSTAWEPSARNRLRRAGKRTGRLLGAWCLPARAEAPVSRLPSTCWNSASTQQVPGLPVERGGFPDEFSGDSASISGSEVKINVSFVLESSDGQGRKLNTRLFS
ncbi:prostaglandin F synthase 2 [Camelus ferus]|nr:prostaglandin F synthase 2 [Camelus ferus]